MHDPLASGLSKWHPTRAASYAVGTLLSITSETRQHKTDGCYCGGVVWAPAATRMSSGVELVGRASRKTAVEDGKRP